jgi:hypothetical protein
MVRLKASKYRERYKDAFSRIAEAEYWVASLESGGRVPTEDARLKVLETIANYADALVAKAERAANPDGERRRRAEIPRLRKISVSSFIHEGNTAAQERIFDAAYWMACQENDGHIRRLRRRRCSRLRTPLRAWMRRHVPKRLGSPYRAAGWAHWLKTKNRGPLAVKREAEEERQ